jgi:hypothetical protein
MFENILVALIIAGAAYYLYRKLFVEKDGGSCGGCSGSCSCGSTCEESCETCSPTDAPPSAGLSKLKEMPLKEIPKEKG